MDVDDCSVDADDGGNDYDEDVIDDPDPKENIEGDFDQTVEGGSCVDDFINNESTQHDDSFLRANAVTYLCGVVIYYLQK